MPSHRPKGEVVAEPKKLLEEMKRCRDVVRHAQGEVRAQGVTYAALSMLTQAIDTVAYYLTGNGAYFGGQPAPGGISWINDLEDEKRR